jgi:hypothetical protein
MTDAAVARAIRPGAGGRWGGEKSSRANDMSRLSMVKHLLFGELRIFPGPARPGGGGQKASRGADVGL